LRRVTGDIIVVLVVVVALAFDFTNGFHDTANAMATTIATGALPPRVAVGIAAVLNFVGRAGARRDAAARALDVGMGAVELRRVRAPAGLNGPTEGGRVGSRHRAGGVLDLGRQTPEIRHTPADRGGQGSPRGGSWQGPGGVSIQFRYATSDGHTPPPGGVQGSSA